VSYKVMRAVWERSKAKGAAHSVLVKIADNADDEGYAYPGERYLARQTNLATRSVIRALRWLRKAGELELVAERNQEHPKYPLSVRSGRGYQPTNLYRIKLPGVTHCHLSNQSRGDKRDRTEATSRAKRRCKNVTQILNASKPGDPARRAETAQSADRAPSADSLNKKNKSPLGFSPEIEEMLNGIYSLDRQNGKDARAWTRHAVGKGRAPDLILSALDALATEAAKREVGKAWGFLENSVAVLFTKNLVDQVDASDQAATEDADALLLAEPLKRAKKESGDRERKERVGILTRMVKNKLINDSELLEMKDWPLDALKEVEQRKRARAASRPRVAPLRSAESKE
jgi:hypothetical protein